MIALFNGMAVGICAVPAFLAYQRGDDTSLILAATLIVINIVAAVFALMEVRS
jgi:hypothetical protein